MKRDPQLYLEDILESIKLIEEYIEQLSLEELSQDKITQDAVARRFEIIGEAAKNLPNDFKDQHPEVPWPHVIAMRNIMAHEYYAVDLEQVWNTIKKDLPNLKLQLLKY